MKDEELAEQFANSHTRYEVAKREDGTEYAKKVSSVTIQQAFLAGLNVGRSQWHDLQKDPNDLPEDKRNVWCDYGDGCGKGHYNKDDGGWWIEGHMFCSIIDA